MMKRVIVASSMQEQTYKSLHARCGFSKSDVDGFAEVFQDVLNIDHMTDRDWDDLFYAVDGWFEDGNAKYFDKWLKEYWVD